MDPINLEEEDNLRAKYLEEAYRRTILRDPRYVLYTEVGEALGLEQPVASRIATYLSREGLLNGGGSRIAITHEGTKLVEARIRERKISQGTTAYLTSAITSHQESRILGRRVFVVHGRNMKARTALFSLLRAFSLEPIEWSQAVAATGEPTPYVGRVLEVAMEMAHAIVVLFTPDDDVLLKREFWEEHEPAYEREMSCQARPNVIFEAGMALGRYPERTLLVQVGNLKPFSDIAGRHMLRLSDSSESRQQLGLRLKSAGSIVNMDGVDWHSAGNFTDAASSRVVESSALSDSHSVSSLVSKKEIRGNEDKKRLSVTTINPFNRSLSQYFSQTLTGVVAFDYSNNNGRFIVGVDEMVFETAWSRGGRNSIHVYSDPPSIESVAIASGAGNFSEIQDASSYDFSSRSRQPNLDEIVVWRNSAGYYLATKIEELKSRGHGDDEDKVVFSYFIQNDRSSSFQ